MKIENINVEEMLKNATKLISEDKGLSPATKIGKAVKGTYEIVSPKKYQERYRDVTGGDPFVCKYCAGQMILWKIWHPKFGYIFDEEEQIKQDKYGVNKWFEERTGHTVRPTARGIQLSLFPLPVSDWR